MKLIVLLLASSFMMANSQNTALVDYVMILQAAQTPLYNQMLSLFGDARRTVGQDLRELNNIGIYGIADSLVEMVGVRDEAEAAVEGLTGDEVCIATAFNTWESAIENYGVGVSGCAAAHNLPIRTATDDFNAFLRVQNQVSLEVQNAVLIGFSRVSVCFCLLHDKL